MKLKVIFTGLFVAAMCLSLLGCKSQEEKVCAHLSEIVDDGGYDIEECMGDIEEIKEDCANADEVLDCLLEKDSEDGLGDCEDICEQGEQEEEGE